MGCDSSVYRIFVTCLGDRVSLSSNTVQMTLSKQPGVVRDPLYL